MRNVELPKTVRVYGRSYICPKQAAKRWVKQALIEHWNKRYRTRVTRRNARIYDARVCKRYYNLVLPIFERLLS